MVLRLLLLLVVGCLYVLFVLVRDDLACPLLAFRVPVMVGVPLVRVVVVERFRVVGRTYSLLGLGCCDGKLLYALGLLYRVGVRWVEAGLVPVEGRMPFVGLA